ncbi:14630_t:CDS:2 [Acaulospora colombiana]|uniref:14630_t:CDS:1 n=1 Tax=Acaulospora colombiana TaxID=27376 RepID=A0ACA9KUU9_9GLOM|nr:14630_t:CDS:2 [Acaulospora colombiana]
MMLKCAEGIIRKAKENELPIVIDADGLFLIQNNPDIIKNYSKAILTPNVNEFRRLCEKMNISFEDNHKDEMAQKLSQAFGGITIVQKGRNDLISNGNNGQGDILTGLIATFLAWGDAYQKKLWRHDNTISSSDIPMLASYAGLENLEIVKLYIKRSSIEELSLYLSLLNTYIRFYIDVKNDTVVSFICDFRYLWNAKLFEQGIK